MSAEHYCYLPPLKFSPLLDITRLLWMKSQNEQMSQNQFYTSIFHPSWSYI
jgi:hypothetical protein